MGKGNDGDAVQLYMRMFLISFDLKVDEAPLVDMS